MLTDDTDIDKVLTLRKQVQTLSALRQLQRDNGINFYVPHAKQHAFHKAAHVTGRHCRTGNRGGKSKCGCAEDIAFCLGYRPWYQKRLEIKNGEGQVVEIHEGHENHPLVTHGIPQRPVKLLLVLVNWLKADELFTGYNPDDWDSQGQLFKFIPKRYLAGVSKGKNGHIEQIFIRRPEKYGGGVSSIRITTVEAFKKNKLTVESSDYDAFHGDEPFPRAMFVGIKRGLVDRGGKFWINCTPIDEMWINDEFIPPDKPNLEILNEGVEFHTKVSGHTISRFVITWSIYDNPWNSKASIAEFENSLTREEKACRLEGLPMSYTGMVYPQFKYDEHVMAELPTGWSAFDKPPADYTIRWWWDYHVRLPQAILFFATGPDGRIYVFDEMFDTNRIDETAEALLHKMADRQVVQTEMDPLAFIPNPVDETTIADQLAPYGIFVERATKDKRLGILNVQKMLAQRGPDGKPVVMFSPHLTETLYEFGRYVYDGDKQKPKDEHDHMMENLYRALLSGLEYITPDNTYMEAFREGEAGRFAHADAFRPDSEARYGSKLDTL